MAQDVEIPSDPLRSSFENKGRLSRYRSVRKAQIKQNVDLAHEAELIPPLPDAAQVHENITRSKSRYRRAPPNRKQAEPMPTLPVAGRPDQTIPWHNSKLSGVSCTDNVRAHAQHPGTHQKLPIERPRVPSSSNRSGTGTHPSQVDHREGGRPNTSGLTEGEQVLANERARYEKIKAKQQAEREDRNKRLQAERQQRAQEEEEIQRLEMESAAEQDRQRRQIEHQREVERPTREHAEAEEKARHDRMSDNKPLDGPNEPSRTRRSRDHSQSKPPSSRESAASPNSSKRLAGFFRRKKSEETPQTSMASTERRPRTSRASPPSAPTAPPPVWQLPTIRPGGGGIVPLKDAPVSGVIDAERRVRIRCGKSEISLPVEPTTSALQLIRCAANVMSEQLNPRAAVMYEMFTSQTLRRPLRMFEHIRAVMNSWQDDDQHFLLIEPSDPESDRELYASFAPTHEPRPFAGSLYWTNKSDKWDKRWVIVTSDGQITTSKNESGKDTMNVCRLSDFDIYTPIPERKKRSKPSKKIVFSIKSQQKSAMFLNQKDFIHHFYASDKSMADTFFRAVQTWRSYYLVNKMGQGQATQGEQTLDYQKNRDHKRSRSADSHYLLGTFNNLGLDFSNFAKPAENHIDHHGERSDSFDDTRPLGALVMPSAQDHSKSMHSRQLSQRKERARVPPPSMRPIDSRAQALNVLNGDTGHHREVSGSSGLQRNTSVRSSRSLRRNSFDSATLGRGNSVKHPSGVRPLVDITPTYKEPPQFQKKGKGFKPEQVGITGPLIECATSPETAIQLPSSQDWRARPVTSGAGLARSGSTRSNHPPVRARSTRWPNGYAVANLETEEGFTGRGLLAKTHGWGNGETGHAMSGNLARGPMVDLSQGSVFADGSLLRKVEKGGAALR